MPVAGRVYVEDPIKVELLLLVMDVELGMGFVAGFGVT
jgi:hypothetical protein